MLEIKIPFDKVVRLVEKDNNGKFLRLEDNSFILEISEDKIYCFKCKKYVSKREYHVYFDICLDCVKVASGG